MALRISPAAKARRAGRRNARIWWAVAAIAAIVVFALANVLYGRSTAPPQPVFPNLPNGYATVGIQPYAIVPTDGIIKARVRLWLPDSYWSDDTRLTADVQLHLDSEDRIITFPKGANYAATDTTLIVSRSTFERYPLDRYDDDIYAYVTATTDSGPVALPTAIVVWGKFPGWRVVPSTSVDPDDPPTPDSGAAVDPSQWEYALASVVVARNGSTMTFVVLILVSMVGLSVLAMWMARWVARRKRRIEATFAGWFAALLFAMFPLRMNMPGAPPIGVWIDFIVFLWVLVVLMAALGIFIVSWLRYSPTPPKKADSPKPRPRIRGGGSARSRRVHRPSPPVRRARISVPPQSAPRSKDSEGRNT